MSNKCLYWPPAGTSYIQTPSFAIPDTGILTIEAWMKSKLYVTDRQTIIGDASYSTTIGYIFAYRETNSNHFYYEYSSGLPGTNANFSNFFQNLDNQWIHIAVVCDYANKTAKAYRNGLQFGVTQNLSGTPLFPITNRVKYIGAYNTSIRKLTDGSLDEVRIYNRGLSDTEVLEHYNGIFKDESGLQLYYSMNEGTGTTVNDLSGNGRHGTLKPTGQEPQWQDFPPQIRGSITNMQGVDNITF